MGGIVVLGSALLGLWPGDGCEHTAKRDAQVLADGVREVRIRARAGSLQVEGRAGATAVRAHGTACTSDHAMLERMRLRVTRQGDAAIVEAEVPDDESWGIGFHTRRLDFTVELPAGLPVEIEDTSGAVEVRDTGSLRLRDGSGSILVRDVHGDARVSDGSGEVVIQDVTGTVTVEDGSGAIEIRNVGAVVIEEDGSGGIEVRDVHGDVVVRRDGSGAIDVRAVGGDFLVEKDGSGGVHHSDVRGRVSVPRGRD